MDNRYADDWVARLERYSGTSVTRVPSRWLVVVNLFAYAMVVVGSALLVVSPGGPITESARRFYASLALFFLFQAVILLNERRKRTPDVVGPGEPD